MTRNFTSLEKLLEGPFRYVSEKKLIYKMENQLEHISEARLLVTTALSGIESIQKMLLDEHRLAIEATSGSLSPQDRSFMNLKFLRKMDDIDHLVRIVNYKNIKLLDGSLYAPSSLTTKISETNSISASSFIEINNATMAEGDKITIAGVTFTARTTMTPDPTDIDITTNTPAGNIMSIQHAIDCTLMSIPTSPTIIKAKQILSGFNFSFYSTSHKIIISCKAGGAICNDVTIGSIVANGSPGDMSLNGINIINENVTFNTGSLGVNGDLYAGKLSSAGTAYNGSETTIARGYITDNILTRLNETNEDNTGINVAGISNNNGFIGKIQGFIAKYTDLGYVDMKISVGDHMYEAYNINTASDNLQNIRFSSIEYNGGYFDLQFDSSVNTNSCAVENQHDADNFASRVNRAIFGINFFQKRTLDFKGDGYGSILPEGSNKFSGNLSGSKFELIRSNFDKLEIEDIEVRSGVTNKDNASIKIIISGETYISGYDKSGTAAPLGDAISPYQSIGLLSTTNPNNMLIFTNGGTILDLSSDDKALACEIAFSKSFNYNFNNGISLISDEDYNFALQIPSLKTSDLYSGYEPLDISTQKGAVIATNIVDEVEIELVHLALDLSSMSLKLKLTESSLESNLSFLKQDQNHCDINIYSKCLGETSKILTDVA